MFLFNFTKMVYTENNIIGLKFQSESGNIWKIVGLMGDGTPSGGDGVWANVINVENGAPSTAGNILDHLNTGHWIVIEEIPIINPVINNNYLIW